MTHFLYLLCFAGFISVLFAALTKGDTRRKLLYGLKVFVQFILISLVMAWIFYFIPW